MCSDIERDKLENAYYLIKNYIGFKNDFLPQEVKKNIDFYNIDNFLEDGEQLFNKIHTKIGNDNSALEKILNCGRNENGRFITDDQGYHEYRDFSRYAQTYNNSIQPLIEYLSSIKYQTGKFRFKSIQKKGRYSHKSKIKLPRKSRRKSRRRSTKKSPRKSNRRSTKKSPRKSPSRSTRKR